MSPFEVTRPSRRARKAWHVGCLSATPTHDHFHRNGDMRRIGMAVLGLVLAAAPLSGQRSALREVRDGGSAGLTLVVAQPLGEFRRHGNVAVGLTAFGVFGRAV